MPVALRAFVALLAVALAVQAVMLFTPLLGDGVTFASEASYDFLMLGAAVLCGARAVLVRRERVAWALMATGLASYSLGNVSWSILFAGMESPPFPSVSDALWLALYPFAYAAIVLLVRSRMPHLDSRLWLDGAIAVLTVSALSAAVVFDAVQEATGGDRAAVITNLAYPIGDMLLAGLVIGVMAAGRGRLDLTWVVFAVGALVFAAADGIYAYTVAKGTYVEGGPLDILWPIGALTIGLAAWQPRWRRQRMGDELPSIAVPVALALTGLSLLVFNQSEDMNELALALDTAAMLAVVWRFAMTHSDSKANLIISRRQARTDALTGLGNRFLLMRDGAAALADDEDVEPHLLLLFDLDGFKNYNDSYGHPAGDALLCRLGARLAAAVGEDGTTYRMGGDEFCVLVRWAPGRDHAPVVVACRSALSEEGDGFRVGASCGHAMLPGDGADISEALRVADRRLYAEKHSGRVPAGEQSAGVLRRALDEWDADLGSHGRTVAVLAGAVACRLGLDDEAVGRVVAAAELHDVGKIALPRDILGKPGPLDDEEWAYVRRHTLIGERIVQAAPALVGVGRLIRSSHERWDGAGYPDGLAGDEIPLGSQIVFICDAFSAMTSDRPYRRAMSEEAAAAELRRTAGAHFAPAVVEAFLAARAAALVPA
ncbi:MAG TPA: HD domain-containing phosphohydrolase [Solirubrobacteraceae bacterium]|jgi:two-component system, cell cycle response regulator|nr:HD domain-containing phosphohydrolase [Solirubrobacteraceae bacterium]